MRSNSNFIAGRFPGTENFRNLLTAPSNVLSAAEETSQTLQMPKPDADSKFNEPNQISFR